MAVSTIDPGTALIVIDLQKGITGIPAAHPIEEVIANSAALAKAFRAKGATVALVNVTGGAPGRTDGPARSMGELPADWAELVPALDAQESDHRVTKQTWGAFTNTDLHERLQAAGVTQVVLVGVATHIGVESTARFAHELGYHVVTVTDAITGPDESAHDHSVRAVFPRLGETGTTAEVLALLEQAD